MAKKSKWNWRRWLRCLEHAQISARAKAIGREIPPVMKNRRRALAPWELPSAPGYDEFVPLMRAGLLYLIPGCGHFAPIIDPMPEANSIHVTAAQARLLRQIVRGRLVYLSDSESGYVSGWTWDDGWSCPPRIPNQGSAHALLKKGLLEWDGCGNWPVFSRRRYRASMRRLCGVRGFRAIGMRWVAEASEVKSHGK